MTCSQGALSAILVEPGSSPHTFDADSEALYFLHEDLAKRGRIIGARGIAGTRSNFAARTREGPYEVSGRLATYTTPADLDRWLPRILGGAQDGTSFPLAETLPSFGVMIDRVGGVFEYQDCYVNRAIWRSRAEPGDAEPEMLEQMVEIIGKEEDATVSWPSGAPDPSQETNDHPYIHADGTLTIDSVEYYFKSFMLIVDNHIEPRWVNSLTATELCPADRTVMLRALFPFTASNDAVFSGLYKHADQLTGVSATLVFTGQGNNCSATFTFEGLQWAQFSPSVRGKTEIEMAVDFVARKTGDSDELSVTNDSTD